MSTDKAVLDTKQFADVQDSDAEQASDLQDLEELKLPKINIGALLMPCVWGPAHGYWFTILFYPLLIFLDTAIRNAVDTGGAAIPVAVIMTAATIGFAFFFAKTCGVKAYARVAHRLSPEKYLKRERIWAVVSALILAVFLTLATIYNLYWY